MPCTPNILPPQPVLPGPFTIPGLTPPGPPDIGVCCQLPPFPVAPGVIPLPPGVINPASIAVVQAALETMSTYLRAIPSPCPRE